MTNFQKSISFITSYYGFRSESSKTLSFGGVEYIYYDMPFNNTPFNAGLGTNIGITSSNSYFIEHMKITNSYDNKPAKRGGGL